MLLLTHPLADIRFLGPVRIDANCTFFIPGPCEIVFEPGVGNQLDDGLEDGRRDALGHPLIGVAIGPKVNSLGALPVER